MPDIYDHSVMVYEFKYKVGDIVYYKLPDSPMAHWGMILKVYERLGKFISLSSEYDVRNPIYDVLTCIDGEFRWSYAYKAEEFEKYSEKVSHGVFVNPIAEIQELTREKDKGRDLIFTVNELIQWPMYPSIVWLEERGCNVLLATLIKGSCTDLTTTTDITFTDRNGVFFEMSIDMYNKKWRAWKQWVRPETRNEMQWGEEDEGTE